MIRLITEFALEKKEIQRRLINVTPKVIEHLMYLALDPNNINRNHWEQEIYSFLYDIEFLKGGKKLPKRDFIYDNTYGVKRDQVLNDKWFLTRVKGICNKENMLRPKDIKLEQNNVDYICNNYFLWLSDNLSKDGIIDDEECYNYIDKLLKNLHKED